MTIKTLMNLLDGRLRSLPLMVIYLTDGCNSRCATCDIWRSPRRNMPLALADALVDAAGTLGTREVLLSGGEAMQHPDWPRIAGQFRAAGVRVLLLTNGLLVKRQIDAVADSVDELIVSLDAATPPLYEAIRGVDALALVLEGIQAAARRGLPVITRTTVQKANYAQIPAIIDAALAAGAGATSFLPVDVSSSVAFGSRDTAPDMRDPSLLDPADVEALAAIIDRLERDYAAEFAAGRIAETPDKLRRTLLAYFAAHNRQGHYPPPPCNAPHFSAVIEVDGTLRPCFFLPAFGRFTPDTTLPAVLNNAAARDLRAAYRQGQRPECAACVCPLHRGIRQLAGS